jgi:Ca2+-binding EF-hand superfamily protein
MKKGIFLTSLVALSLASIQGPALADHDGWFNKYDRDHDGRWNYDEFCAYQKAHHKHLSDREMREMYDRYDRDHDGYWRREEAHEYHH